MLRISLWHAFNIETVAHIYRCKGRESERERKTFCVRVVFLFFPFTPLTTNVLFNYPINFMEMVKLSQQCICCVHFSHNLSSDSSSNITRTIQPIDFKNFKGLIVNVLSFFVMSSIWRLDEIWKKWRD